MPTDFLVWLVLGFTPSGPSFLVPLFAGLGLLLVLIAYPRMRLGDGSVKWILFWFCISLSGLLGLVCTTEWDYALNWLLHFIGIATYGLSVWWASRHDNQVLRTWCFCVALGTMLLCGYGLYQRFGGFHAQLEEMQRQHLEEYGEPLPKRIEAKLMQLRVNSFFSDPNVFAAHLLLTLPVVGLCVLALRNLSRKSRLFMLACLGAFGLLMLFFTGSRGGIIGLGVGACVGVWTSPRLQTWRWKWCLPMLAVLFSLFVWWYASASLESGQISTASVRFEYYRVAMQMFSESPWTGKGLGEFFPYYVRMKAMGAEMTRDPHSFFFGALSQCGILGGLSVILALCFPFVVAFRRTRWSLKPAAEQGKSTWGLSQILPLAGFSAWAIHSCFQFNELIPGTIYLVPVLPLLVLARPDDKNGEEATRRDVPWCWLPASLLAIGCMVWVGLKIPAEYRYQKVSEDIVFLNREIRGLHQQVPGAGMEEQMMVLKAKRQRIRDELLELSRQMPYAIGPCKDLQKLLREDILTCPDRELIDEDTWKLLKAMSEQLIKRTPHRSTAYCEKAWNCLASGDGKEAQPALEQAMVWFPGDATPYLLGLVTPGDWNALRLVQTTDGIMVRKEDGHLHMTIKTYDRTTKDSLEQLLGKSRNMTFDYWEER